MVSIVAFIGPSASGKTTLIEGVVRELSSRGLSVGTVKHIRGSDLSIDVKGKDTWRHAQAGAKVVVGAAAKQVVVIERQTSSYGTLEEIIDVFGNKKLDVIIIEGFRSLVAKRSDVLKVVLVKQKGDVGESLREIAEPIVAIVGPGTLRNAIPKGKSASFFDFDSEREKAVHLVANTVASAQKRRLLNRGDER